MSLLFFFLSTVYAGKVRRSITDLNNRVGKAGGRTLLFQVVKGRKYVSHLETKKQIFLSFRNAFLIFDRISVLL